MITVTVTNDAAIKSASEIKGEEKSEKKTDNSKADESEIFIYTVLFSFTRHSPSSINLANPSAESLFDGLLNDLDDEGFI